MPNSTNEVILNGRVIMSTRGNTVTEDTLVQGEVAQDKTGKDITGNLDPVSHEELNELKEQVDALNEEAYKISDEEGEISEDDYIPYNDASDGNEPKKKTLFSSIIDKLKDIFAQKSDLKSHTFEMGTVIPANSDLDDYKTEGVYFVADVGTAETIDNIPVASAGKLIVMDRDTGTRIFQIYIASKDNIYIRDMNNESVFSAWKNISRSHTFELGEMIPSSSDLDSYKTEGVYYVQLDSTASTISNVPVTRAGKLIVARTTSANTYLIQTYCANASTDIYVRWYNPNDDSWHDWENLSRSHSFEDGTAIPVDSDLNDYKTAGVYTTSNDATASTIANIPASSTGKLIVSYSAPSHNYIQQIYIKASTNKIYTRYYDNWNLTWRGWKQLASIDDISPSTVGNGYAVATVSGSTITATISGFQLRTGVIVSLQLNNEVVVNCTLNISGTGAKTVKTWADENISYGRPLDIGLNTFIYDGIYYRRIAYDKTPNVHNQSYVADTSGNIVLDWGYQVNRVQIKYSLSSDKLVWNYYKNFAWRGDKGIIDVTGGQTMEGWLGLKAGAGRTIASGAHQLGVSDTIPNILNELRYSNGAWGSFVLGTAYTLNQTTIPTGYYNYFYIPHRVGGENWATPTSWDADNVQYGTLLLFGMNNTNGMFRLRWANGSVLELEDMQKGNCYVGTCTTASATKDKVATVDGNFVLRKGVRVAVKFSNSNTYSSSTANPVTLNVNGTGAKNIWYNTTHSGAGNTGTYSTPYGVAGRYNFYIYDGTYWVWDSKGNDDNSDYRKSFYGTCSTAGDQQVKVVTLADTTGWELRAGTMVHVRFSNSNTFNSQTSTPVQLNVNNTGAKNIWYNTAQSGSGNTGTNTRIYGEVNRVFTYVYDGTYWCWVSCGYEADTVDPRALGFGYGTCATAEATTAKVVTLDSYTLRTGGFVAVKFTYAVPANSTMNINSRGAKEIWHRGAKITANKIKAGDLATFIYDGTRYQLVANDRYIT